MDANPGADASTPVAVVGAGPVGLSLALGLARNGVRSVLLERRPGTNDQSRAPGIHQRTREIFRQWGVEQPLAQAGVLRRALALHDASGSGRPYPLWDFSALDEEADHCGLLVLEQGRTEQILLEAVRASGRCEVRFGAEAVGLESTPEGVRLAFREDGAEHRLRARFAVGCDGANSFVRTALGLPFEGVDMDIRPTLADVDVDDERDALDWPRVADDGAGFTGALRLAPGRWRIVRIEEGSDRGREVTEDEVGGHASQVLGPGPLRLVWASRFRFRRRSSPRYRVGPVLLAGDAAHIFPPTMGQGMNTGIQDAHNLAWKLAQALRGGDRERLLDSYEVERRAVVGEVSRYVNRMTRLVMQTPRPVRQAVLANMGRALRVPAVHRAYLRSFTMIDRRYPASPLLEASDRGAGRRLPDVLLRAPDGTRVRLYDLVAQGPALIELVSGSGAAPAPPRDSVAGTVVVGPSGHRDPTGALRRLLGGRDGWILVRPDLYVAWARSSSHGMGAAVRRALGGR